MNYIKTEISNDYKNYIVEKSIYKNNPIARCFEIAEGDYEFNSLIPSNEANLTRRKINNLIMLGD